MQGHKIKGHKMQGHKMQGRETNLFDCYLIT